jgi:general secretion pathway protein D
MKCKCNIKILSLILLALFLCACAAPKKSLDTSRLHSRLQTAQPGENLQNDRQQYGIDHIAPEKKDSQGRDYQLLDPLSGDLHRQVRTKEMAKSFDETPSLTVAADELPLTDFIHRVFGQMLEVNYVLSSKVPEKETVSLNLQEKISPKKLFEITSEMLEEHKISVREKDGVFHIGPAPEKEPLSIGWGKEPEDIPSAPGHVRQIVPLQYIQAGDMRNIVAIVPETKVFSHPGENAVSVTGPREGVEQVLEYISLFDRPAMRGRFVARIRLNYLSPGDLLPRLKELLRAESVPLADQPGQGGVQMIGLDRWRQVLVFAAEKKWIQRVRYWIEMLDEPEQGDERRYFIYFPENSRALDLMQTLQNIMGLSGGSRAAGQAEEKDFSRSLYTPAGGSGGSSGSEKADTSGNANSQDNGKTKDSVKDRVSGLAVDETRNALIVYAKADEYKAIEGLLHQLDIMPPQVLIEATVAEVTLVDDLKYGLEWYLKNTARSQTSVLSTLDGLGLGSAGIQLSSVTDSEKFRMMVNALAEEELVQVLSSPRITVRDGKAANINVGTQVPVVTSETASIESTTTEGTGVVRTYQYRDTGVILQITPTVHARDVVTLEISQEVSEVGSTGTQNPTILNRTLSTDVVATGGQTLVIGGLIKENNSGRDSKVPFLGDLPLIGNLFKNTSRSRERTELVVMITPHIIRSTQQIDDIRRALFEKFNYLKTSEE